VFATFLCSRQESNKQKEFSLARITSSAFSLFRREQGTGNREHREHLRREHLPCRQYMDSTSAKAQPVVDPDVATSDDDDENDDHEDEDDLIDVSTLQ
jgi:hypothetical protein